MFCVYTDPSPCQRLLSWMSVSKLVATCRDFLEHGRPLFLSCYMQYHVERNNVKRILGSLQLGFVGAELDHFVYSPSQWEKTLQCNVISHWLDAYSKWSLSMKISQNCQTDNLLVSVLLTHWGWVTHIGIITVTIINSDNGLAPGQCQAII